MRLEITAVVPSSGPTAFWRGDVKAFGRLFRFWPDVSPWVYIGTLMILVAAFFLMTVENLHRQKESSTRLLREKGAALIRSFEAGTRTGMMGMMGMHGRGGFRLQRLLMETSEQADIVYLAVTDDTGRIIAHSDSDRIGTVYSPEGIQVDAVVRAERIAGRIVETPEGKRVFEVYRRFSPTGGRGMGHGRMGRPMVAPDAGPQAIFVGLDMSAIEAARRADTRHTLVMGGILLALCAAGFFLLFLAHGYRRARASLSRLAALSETLVTHIPIGLLALDSRGRVAACNPAAAAILGRSAGATEGRVAAEAVPTDLLETAAAAGDGTVEREIDCRVAAGDAIPLDVVASGLKDDTGASLGSVILFKDLREMRALRREMEKNRRLASVGRLAAGVAHEIRNPLSSIKGFATYFRDRYGDVPEDARIAGVMIGEVDRLDRVVSQLLDFARPLTLTRTETSLATAVDGALRLVENRLADAGVRVTTDLDPSVRATADPDRLRQVILNLLINAVEAMDGGGSVMVSVTDGGRGPEIRLADTGPGISAEALAHVFDPYFTTKRSGTGLGLAIANNIMEAHGGTIRMESDPEAGGTTAVLTFPPSGSETRK